MSGIESPARAVLAPVHIGRNRDRQGAFHRADRALAWILRGTSLVAASIVVLVVGFLGREAAEGLRTVGVWRFATDSAWQPNQEQGEFGLGPMVVATLATTAGAVLLAAPIGVLAALFHRFNAPLWLANAFRRGVELLAGIPSVVYGFWGLVTLVPLVRQLAPPGPSLLSGVLVLAMMIVPTIALLSIAALERLPNELLRAASALDLSRWATYRAVVFPYVWPGLASAVLLGTLRAMGETMAILMVCGNVTRLPTSLFDPVRTLTANIALELGYATAEHRSVLFVSGLALMCLVALLVVLHQSMGARSKHV